MFRISIALCALLMDTGLPDSISMYTRTSSNTLTRPLLQYDQAITYAWVALLTAAGLFVPFVLHQFHMAGQVFLPIYFFTLVGTYKFGWRAGLSIAIMTPLVNHVVTAMPVLAVLPLVILKGTVLVAAVEVCARLLRFSLLSVGAAVIAAQLLGSLLVYGFTQNSQLALSDITIGYPGLIAQVVFGYALLLMVKDHGKNENTD